MNNADIITAIHEIASPYFQFNIDVYGDKGSSSLPNIEDLHMLFFKLMGKINSKTGEEILQAIRNIDFGYKYVDVDFVKIGSIGWCIRMYFNEPYGDEYILLK